jgi:hypothetical protein
MEDSMAVQTGPQTRGAPASYEAYEDDRGAGWLTFSGVLLLTLGTFNVIDGISAIANAHVYVANARYVFGDLNTWGWVILCLGSAQLLVGAGIFARNQLARWTGVAVLSLNAIAQLLMMPAYPFWSLAIFGVDIVAIYGLVAYGHRISRA